MADRRLATIAEAGKFFTGVELASYYYSPTQRCTYEGIDKRSCKPVLRVSKPLFSRYLTGQGDLNG